MQALLRGPDAHVAHGPRPWLDRGDLSMSTGTITEFDGDGLFGVIDSDDGRLLVFNVWAVEPALRRYFTVGSRVRFLESGGHAGPRAVSLSTLDKFPASLPHLLQ